MKHSPAARLTALLTALAFSTAAAPVAFAQDAPPAAPNPKLEAAKRHMEAGAAFYNDPGGHKCEEAYREFKKAYELSGSLNALKGMGVCSLELERDGEAIDQLEKYLAGKGETIDPGDKRQVENDLKALRSAVAWVTISTDRPSVTITDVRTPSRGLPVTNRYAGTITGKKLGLHPGNHTITASSDGLPDLVWKVDLSNGGAYEKYFEFDKGKPVTAEGFTDADLRGGGKADEAPAGDRPVPTTVYVLGGLTAALAVPTVIFMVKASGDRSDFDAANGTQPAAQLDEMRSDVQTSNLMADIFLGATVVSLAATAVLYLTRPEAPAASKEGSISLVPAMGPNGGGAFLSGRF